jgi:hypothetical protein
MFTIESVTTIGSPATESGRINTGRVVDVGPPAARLFSHRQGGKTLKPARWKVPAG